MVGPIPAWMIASLGQTLLVLLFPFVDVLWMTFVLAALFGLFYDFQCRTLYRLPGGIDGSATATDAREADPVGVRHLGEHLGHRQ